MTAILILAKGNSPRCDFLPPKNTHTTQQEALADLGGGFLFPFFSFSHKCKGSRGTGAAGRAALGAARIKGETLFREREYPPKPPRERTRGLAPRPRTLADRHLKSCAACGIRCLLGVVSKRLGLLLSSLSLCLRFGSLTQFPPTLDLYRSAIACRGGFAGARRSTHYQDDMH